ncbi:hypothetical protein C815_01559 [Firmicutes bacterium M10-2]|nr:hypothetical protein C815_01559 [Firmicutes bacterium M10-2]
MKKTYFTIRSCTDGIDLSVMTLIPDTVVGVVQLVHGMAEHKERYLPFMRFLANHGYATIIHDHRGHGASVKDQDDLGYFGNHGAHAIVEDVLDVYRVMKERYPNVPYTLFGHSMGSLIVRRFIQKYDDLIDQLIVCGAPGNNPYTKTGLKVVDALEKSFGERYRSFLVSQLLTGTYDRKFEGNHKNRWISANESNVHAFNTHERDGFTFTLNGYKNLFQLVRDVYDPKGWSKKNPNLPILFVAGKDDPVILSIEKWEEAQQFLKKEGYQNVYGILFSRMRHEILNETNNQMVYDVILDFIEGSTT